MERLTRKNLLQKMSGVHLDTEKNPVAMFVIDFADDAPGGELKATSREILSSRTCVMARLMDLSLRYRVMSVDTSIFNLCGWTCVRLTVSPDRKGQTNIDAEFMERIAKMRFKWEDNDGKV